MLSTETPWITLACVLVAASASNEAVALDVRSGATIAYDRSSGLVTLQNGRLELVIETRNGLNPNALRDKLTGRLYADTDYVWPGGVTPKLVGAPKIVRKASGRASVTFKASLGALDVQHVFWADPDFPDGIFESITIRNNGSQQLANPGLRMGFGKRVKSRDAWAPDAEALRFCGIPYRRDTDGVVRDLPLRKVVEEPTSYATWADPPNVTPTWGSEGWVWSGSGSSLVIAKFAPNAMEWALLSPEKRGSDTLVCFGGAGIWRKGSPQGAMNLAPGKSFTFGETLLRAVEGDWKAGYYAFRSYTESKGCRPHPGYNPPVHWNELYDNPYFNAVCSKCPGYDSPALADFLAKDNRKLLNDLYSLEAMKGEAAKARELGCEALYHDPGWDTGPSHHVWDTKRLGPEEEYVAMMQKDYGLKVSVWVGLAGAPPTFHDATVLPKEAWLLDKNGNRPKIVCVCSPVFREAKKKLLIDLAKKGITFMMFDSTQFTGKCYDPSHGHSIPATEEEHADAVYDILHAVKQASPKLLIELHDPVTGPGSAHYTPTYLFYTRGHSFDCIWGQEFMWNSMDDLVSGRALSLYYYNLGCSIPIYLHVGLNTDNANALVFWWYASTCRHLGVGGKSHDPAVWEAQKAAMRTYLPLKRFFVQGAFYGLDETVHAHTLADQRMSVMNVFNLKDAGETRTITFRPSQIGLADGRVRVEGAEAAQAGDQVTLTVLLPAKGHALVKIIGGN